MKHFLFILFFFLLVTQICSAQGSWIHIGEIPEIRLSHTADELNGKIYIVGGWNTEQGSILTTALVYDRAESTWTTIPLLNNEFRGAHTSIVVDSKLYVIGGYAYSGPNYVASAKVDMYDPDSGWTSKNPMPAPRTNLACASIEDKIYVMGGIDLVSWTGLRRLEVYDVSTNEWDTTKAPMPTGRWGLSAVAYNGKIYVFGGATGVATTVYDSVLVYDPQTNIWTVKSNMPTKRYSITTCLLDNKIYVIGGWLHSNYGPIYDKVEVYNPESDTWYTETPMPVARALLASIVLDGKIQVFGGSRTTHPLIGSSGIYEFSPFIPVELVSFSAVPNDMNVILNWSTATETNNSGFSIERKSDGSEYSEISFVQGLGTTTETKLYSYTDSKVSIGRYTYRLKQIDFDGSYEYSPEVEAEVSVLLEFSLEQNYPNPFNPGTVISYQLPATGNATIKVYDILGNEVATLFDEHKPAGRYEVEFNAANLPSGVYFYQLRAGSYIETKKMILMK